MMIESGTSIEEAAAVAVAAAAVQDVSGPIRVAIVEDLPQIREGLSVLIDGTEGYSCVGTYESVEEALPGLCERQPQVLLLDIHLPGMAGSEGVKLIKEKLPGTQVLMLTVFDADEHIFTSLCNGASGYLLKKTPPTRLLEAISQAHTGGSPMTPEIARKVIRMFQLIKPTPKLEHDLTPQEVRLLRLLATPLLVSARTSNR